MELVKPTPLSEAEKAQARLYARGDWAVLRHDAEAQITVWVKREGDQIKIRETQDIAPILDHNKNIANQWSGWSGKKNGAVVAAIPTVIYNKLKKECGFDGCEYDQKAMNKKLNSSDYAYLRTGGGRL